MSQLVDYENTQITGEWQRTVLYIAAINDNKCKQLTSGPPGDDAEKDAGPRPRLTTVHQRPKPHLNTHMEEVG